MTAVSGVARHAGINLGEAVAALETFASRQGDAATFFKDTVAPALKGLLPHAEARRLYPGVSLEIADPAVIRPGGAGTGAWADAKAAVTELASREAKLTDGLPAVELITERTPRGALEYLRSMEAFETGMTKHITVARETEHRLEIARWGYPKGDNARQDAQQIRELARKLGTPV